MATSRLFEYSHLKRKYEEQLENINELIAMYSSDVEWVKKIRKLERMRAIVKKRIARLEGKIQKQIEFSRVSVELKRLETKR